MRALWVVGTHRVLKVEGGNQRLDQLLGEGAGRYFLFGNFSVCPLAKEKPKAMRPICIREAKNLKRVARGSL